jgi:hypothetical protein
MSIYKSANHEFSKKSGFQSMVTKNQKHSVLDTKKYKDQVQNIEEILNNHASDPVHINNIFFMST